MKLIQNCCTNAEVILKNETGVFVKIKIREIESIDVLKKSFFWGDKTSITLKDGSVCVVKMCIEDLQDILSSAKSVDEKIEIKDLCKDIKNFDQYYNNPLFTIRLDTLQRGSSRYIISYLQSVSYVIVDGKYYTKIWLKEPIQEGIFLHDYITVDISFDDLIKRIESEYRHYRECCMVVDGV